MASKLGRMAKDFKETGFEEECMVTGSSCLEFKVSRSLESSRMDFHGDLVLESGLTGIIMKESTTKAINKVMVYL